MDPDIVIRALVYAAYQLGWRNACDDHLEQRQDPHHPIGTSRIAGVDLVLANLDPNNLLNLQEKTR